MGQVFGYGALGFVLGAVLTVGLAVGASAVLDISQAEGAFAMQVAFFYVPVGSVLGLIAGIVMGRKR